MASEKETAAIWSTAASFLLAVIKFIAALATGSLGVLSEAVHSLVDFGATLITWGAVHYSDLPPDDTHPYGHEKIEAVAALVATALLFLTMGWIIYEAVGRLITGDFSVHVTWWAGAVILVSIAVDYNRSRSLKAVAERTHSLALEADSLHFSADMWSSGVVLAGLVAAWFGYGWADTVAALVVSLFVGQAGWHLGRRTIDALLDTVSPETMLAVRRLLEDSNAVLRVESLRIRPVGQHQHIEAVVAVPRTLEEEARASLKRALTQRILADYPGADIFLSLDPVALDDETLFQRVMLIAVRHGAAIHHVTVQMLDGHRAVSFDLEVPGQMSLGEAHDFATRLEDLIRAEIGDDVEVESHIQPRGDVEIAGVPLAGPDAEPILKLLASLAAATPGLSDLHNIRLRRVANEIFVHYHCRFDPSDAVEAVYAAVTHMNHELRSRRSDIRRIIAHTEPVGARPHAL